MVVVLIGFAIKRRVSRASMTLTHNLKTKNKYCWYAVGYMVNGQARVDLVAYSAHGNKGRGRRGHRCNIITPSK